MNLICSNTIESYNDFKTIIGDFKRSNRRIVTNYVPNPKNHRLFVESHLAKSFITDDVVIITFDKGFMLDVIFFASDVSKVDSILKEIQNNVKLPLVLEFVVRDDNVASIGSPDKTLRRMSRYSSAYKRRTENNRTVKATHEDITDLKYLFSSHFDPLSERIPDSEELNRLIDNDGIYIIRDEDKIIGMVVYERSGVNIHLRYWWVDSSYRNMRVGGELLEQYFKAGEDCKCQFLWVFKDNANAIDKYKHYGFEFDGVRDEIFIYK